MNVLSGPSRPPILAAQRATRTRAWLLGAAAVLLFLFTISRRGDDPAADAASAATTWVERPGWPKLQNMDDLETLWEVPDGPVKGVLFVAHGCSHAGSDFWPASQHCSHCLGLPEELAVRHTALRRGYAVVAVSSYDRKGARCWHNTQPSRSEDLQRLPGILQTVIREEGLEAVPLYAFGASSGGGIVLRLAQAMPEVKGVICQINPVNPGVFEVPQGRAYPPTIFVHMAQRDPSKAETVTKALKILGDAKVPAAEIKIDPQPLTVAFLMRSPLIRKEVAGAIVAQLNANGYLDKKGQLIKDPRSEAHKWRELLAPLVGELSLEADASHVAELMNVAFARHEIVGETTNVTLAWLEAGGRKSVKAVEEELQRQAGPPQEGL